jgi:hypothetical protein
MSDRKLRGNHAANLDERRQIIYTVVEIVYMDSESMDRW